MYQLPSNGAKPLPPEPLEREDEFQRIWGAVRRRKRAFWWIFGGFMALAFAYAFVWPKSYQTSINIITGNSATNYNGVNTDLPVLNALIAAGGVQSAETYATMIQDYDVATQVIQDLHLHTDAYRLLKYYIYVEPVTNTQIITLQTTWNDPQVSADISNDFARVVMEKDRRLVADQSQNAMDYLAAQIPAAEADKNRADKALAQFEATHTVADISAQTQSVVGQYSDVISRLAQVQVDRAQAQAALGSSQSQMASMVKTTTSGTDVAQNPVVTQLQQQLSQVNVELEAARKQYTEAHPTVIALEQQQTTLQKELGSQPKTYVASNTVVPNPVFQQLQQQESQLRAQIAGDDSQAATLKAQLGSFGGQVQSLPEISRRLADLQRNAQLNEGIYDALRQHYDDAVVAKSMALSNIVVDQPAEAEWAKPIPNIPLTIALGLVLGLTLAVAGVFTIDFFDSSLKDEDDVRRALPYPVLAQIPQLDASSKRNQAKLPMMRALTIEAYLQLITSLRFASDKPLRTIAVVSPIQGDGKSTIALSTAIAMGEMRPRVLLIDGDMRHPTLHEKLGVDGGPGLADVLVGEKSAQDVISSTRFAGLDFLPAGSQAPNPLKLIQSKHFDELIDELLKTYQTIVFDTPALLPMVDATAVAAKSDGTVMVVAAGQTDERSALRARQRLSAVEGVNIVGVVINRSTPNPKDTAYVLQSGSQMPLSGELETV
jgi:capsular exopolysaccharide synthesis family protein